MSRSHYPQARSDIILREFQGDLVVYDPVQDRTAILNATAAVVFKACTGDNSLEIIINEYVSSFSLDFRAARQDVLSVLKELARLQLLASS